MSIDCERRVAIDGNGAETALLDYTLSPLVSIPVDSEPSIKTRISRGWNSKDNPFAVSHYVGEIQVMGEEYCEERGSPD